MPIRRIQSTAAVPLWRPRDDPNYPGALVDENLTAKTTSRATVTYETYVLQYAARQRGHVLLVSGGTVLTLGAGIYLNGPALVLLAALGVGLALAGIVGFLIAADAHASYTRDLAVSVSETYNRRPPAPPATVRPFVTSSNSDGRTTNTGRLNFEPGVWQSLFNLALANGGCIVRDTVVKPARVGRDWYHGEGYGRLLEELTRLGFIDGRNRLTPAALSWYEQQIALPLDAIPGRSHNERTNGERTAVNGRDLSEWGDE